MERHKFVLAIYVCIYIHPLGGATTTTNKLAARRGAFTSIWTFGVVAEASWWSSWPAMTSTAAIQSANNPIFAPNSHWPPFIPIQLFCLASRPACVASTLTGRGADGRRSSSSSHMDRPGWEFGLSGGALNVVVVLVVVINSDSFNFIPRRATLNCQWRHFRASEDAPNANYRKSGRPIWALPSVCVWGRAGSADKSGQVDGPLAGPQAAGGGGDGGRRLARQTVLYVNDVGQPAGRPER